MGRPRKNTRMAIRRRIAKQKRSSQLNVTEYTQDEEGGLRTHDVKFESISGFYSQTESSLCDGQLHPNCDVLGLGQSDETSRSDGGGSKVSNSTSHQGTSTPTISMMYSELKTRESALCALKDSDARLAVALQWITRFHGKIPDDLKSALEAAVCCRDKPNEDHGLSSTNKNSYNESSSIRDLNSYGFDDHDTSFSDPPSPSSMEFEETEVKPDISSVEMSETETESNNGVKLVDIEKLLEVETEEETKVHKCSYCSATFDSMQQLSVHALLHSKLRLTRMSKKKINLATQKPRVYNYSIRRLKNKYIVITRPNELVVVTKPSNASKSPQPNGEFGEQHQRLQQDLQCQFCRKVFVSQIELSNHLSTVHRSRRFVLKKNTQEHKEPEIFKCTICDKNFDTELKMRNHKLGVHPAPSEARTCEVCGKIQKTQAILKAHMKQSHPDPSLAQMCDICGQVYRSQLLLKKHKRSVHAERSFLCQTCGFAMKTETALKDHVKRTHMADVRAFKCQHCPKAFKLARTLARHKARHLGKVGKECPYCGLFKMELYNHITIVHKGRKFKCAQCPAMFSLRAHVKNHYLLKHPDIPMPLDSEFEVVYTGTIGNTNEVAVEPTKGHLPASVPGEIVKRTKCLKSRSQSKSNVPTRTSTLSCSVCVSAVFSSRDDFELHMRRHSRDPNYKLRHRTPVHRLNVAVTDIELQNQEDQTIVLDMGAGGASSTPMISDLSNPVNSSVSSLLPNSSNIVEVEDILSFSSYMNL